VYEPTRHGHEGAVAERLTELRRRTDAERGRRGRSSTTGPDSDEDRPRTEGSGT
jgi:hypothetical protein